MIEWFNGLDLAFNRRVIPVAHNYPFEAAFLKEWLGVKLSEEIWLGVARDSQAAAVYINERAAMQGRDVPFDKVTLAYLCDYFGIPNENPHDALNDAIAGARVFHQLTRLDILL